MQSQGLRMVVMTYVVRCSLYIYKIFDHKVVLVGLFRNLDVYTAFFFGPAHQYRLTI
jgi:hypothetical protein